jgi:HPr kinase/phosphorylase
LGGRGVLILGASGRGKSGLALALMALGADLVADDRVIVTSDDQGLVASAPAALHGMIEARGIGLLKARAVESAPLHLAVDLDQVETARLPENRSVALLDRALPLLHSVETPHFAAAVLQYLKEGRAFDNERQQT